MSTIFWGVLLANIVSYAIVDAIKDALLYFNRKKRKKELEAYLDYLEDEEADDDDEECCEDDK